MYKPDDKDIDRLSREAAEHYHPPGNPSWDALRATLDKELPQKEKKRRGFLFFLLLGLGLSLAGTVTVYVIKRSEPVKQGMQPIVAAEKAGPATTSTGSPLKKTQEAEPAASNQAGNLTAESAPGTVTDKSTPVALPPAAGAANTSTSSNTLNRVSGSHKQSASFTDKKTNRPVLVQPGLTDTENKGSLRIHSGNVVKNRKANTTAAGSVTDEGATAGAVGDRSEDANKAVHSKGQDPVQATTAPAGQSQQPKNTTPAPTLTVSKTGDSAKPAAVKAKSKSPANRAILLGITAGLDMSTVKFTHGSNTGYNLGLAAGYQFSRHWSAYTGIIYTNKNYKLNGEDYHPPKHYWTQYVQLQTVDGYCRMWEIPVTARYTFNPGSKSAFFAGAGVSSYFMKKQGYDYYYKTNTGGSMQSSWASDSTFNHVFSILDLSVGVVRPIGKNLSLQIEPYAKIPMGGLGFGNIRLSSFGVNLTVQYSKFLKK